ncbi:hypothetical protein JV173_05460 [Acholeplasma equirhinis]|nr:YccF domain-containing protein [Acholeplasma equirhinis]MBN3490962.1 hypothetical protein [Acholeplasma equirhinis]
MKLLGNIIWFVFGGLFAAIWWFLLGILFHILIITIPFGRQCFKFAKQWFKLGKLALIPFGATIKG